MSEDAAPPIGPDLRHGISLSEVTEGEPLFGHVGNSPVVVFREGEEIRAFNAACTHYGAPLAEGVLVHGSLRCPWHHARFSLEDGSVEGGPAFNPLARRAVSVTEGVLRVGEAHDDPPLKARGVPAHHPERVVIVGSGAAGISGAETLRREGYAGPIHLVDPDPDAPYDRPNLSKDYLAGEAPEEWIPLRSHAFLEENGIHRVVDRVRSLDLDEGKVLLQDGEPLPFDALLLATGARARELPVPGADQPHVHTLRSLADCRSIIRDADGARAALVVGASFIGMEVAASLRTRGLKVTVVAPEDVPFAPVFGGQFGTFLQSLMEEKGVSFRLGNAVKAIREKDVILADGASLAADLVVVGVGVEPRTELAKEAGLKVDDGILVDEFLRTSHPRVFAAGDVARYPEARTAKGVRIEHWVLAGRHGRTAAQNILGHRRPFRDVPFFWTKLFDVPVTYIGHAEDWDEAVRAGDCSGDEGCSVTFRRSGRRLALATVHRDQLSLKTEAGMEEGREVEVRPPGGGG